MSSHSHVCGFDIPDRLSQLAMLTGCGFEWTHDPDLFVTETEKMQAHVCPNCGTGPWAVKYNDESKAFRLEIFGYQKRALENAFLLFPSKDPHAYDEERKYLEGITKILNQAGSI